MGSEENELKSIVCEASIQFLHGRLDGAYQAAKEEVGPLDDFPTVYLNALLRHTSDIVDKLEGTAEDRRKFLSDVVSALVLEEE